MVALTDCAVCPFDRSDLAAVVAGHPRLAALNRGALADPRVRVVNADAFRWLDAHDEERFDFAVVDFPDPSNYAVGKLYTVAFYELLARHLVEPVRWLDVQRTLVERVGVTHVVELAPAGTLTAMAKRAIPEVEVLSLDALLQQEVSA